MQRRNNAGVILTKLKMSSEDIKYALLSMDTSVIHGDVLTSLSNLFQLSDSEQKAIESYSGDVSLLNVQERFFYDMRDVVYINDRLDFLIFKAHLDEMLEALNGVIILLRNSTEQVRTSKKFQRVLKVLALL